MVQCIPSSLVVGHGTTCKATVVGSPTPTGKVTWSTSGGGKFATKSCALKRGACSVKYTTNAAGAATITANYAGDKKNPASSVAYILEVLPATSKVSIVCSHNSVKITKTTKCTAIVTGYKPTGNVTWGDIAGPGSVSFNGDVITCTLTSGRCSVTLTAVQAGEVVIQAAYIGDANNVASYNTHTLIIHK
jgi:hypothetical protein